MMMNPGTKVKVKDRKEVVKELNLKLNLQLHKYPNLSMKLNL